MIRIEDLDFKDCYECDGRGTMSFQDHKFSPKKFISIEVGPINSDIYRTICLIDHKLRPNWKGTTPLPICERCSGTGTIINISKPKDHYDDHDQ